MREAMLAAGSAASLAALLFWLGPPGNDLAAHVYQRTIFLHDGFQLWNNSWYGGRYAFVTYSVIYYPLAAVFGIKALAVISIATAAARIRHRRLPAVGPARPVVEPDLRSRLGGARHLGRVPVRARVRARPALALGAPGREALVVRNPRGSHRRREPARVPPAGDLPRRRRPRNAGARTAAARPDADRRRDRPLPVPAHARVRRRRPLPVLDVRALLDHDLLRPRRPVDVARRPRAHDPLVLRRLRGGEPRRVRGLLPARREHRARPLRRAADHGAHPLAAAWKPFPVAALALVLAPRGTSVRTRGATRARRASTRRRNSSTGSPRSTT